jgi:DNA polymerase III delta subunit
MVRASGVYLFLGQDRVSKEIKLKRIKEEFLAKEIEQFSLDILYAKDLSLKSLQERLLSLPFKAKKRIIVLRQSQDLKEDIKEFILKYMKNCSSKILLIIDVDNDTNRKTKENQIDEFIKNLARYAQVLRFKEEPKSLDAFALVRQIDLKKPEYALRILNQLLKNGERPERILGGLRYSWQKYLGNAFEIRKRIKLLLNCDIEIKTGRLKPDFALEKLVVKLCCL